MKIAIATAVLALVACSKKGNDDKQQPPTPLPAPGPACDEQVAQLETWLGDLAADGVTPWFARGVKLVTLPGEAIKPFDRQAQVITFGTTEISMDGVLLATAKPEPTAFKDALLDRFSAKPDDEVVMLVDEATPWSAMVAASAAAIAKQRARVTLAFHAGAPGRASPPPPSAIDAEIAALASSETKAADLAGNRPTLPPKVFASCKPALDFLATLAGSGSGEHTRKIVDGLPAAIATCDCKVEIASVQRLMWAWWMRDAGEPFTWVTIEVAKDGAPITAEPGAPWSETSALVIAAAKQGKPVVLK